MKFNKWTLGLAALGVVSISSAARAEEKLTALQSALTATSFSGYADVSAQWNFGKGNRNNPPYKFGGDSKADGFNLNVVQLTISKPLEEGDWASGYRADLWFGPDANFLNTASAYGGSQTYYPNRDFAIRQAYVALRVPVGNGLDLKLGVFDDVIGYESVEDGSNPNHTRSYGMSMEPTTLTGVSASYRFSDAVSVTAGVANTVGPQINTRAFPTSIDSDAKKSEAAKAYFGSIALTAPSSWGWASGSMLYAGVLYGYNDVENAPAGTGSDIDENSINWYVGGTLSTPVTGLKVGAAFDYVHVDKASGTQTYAIAGYASYQVNEKTSVHARAEYLRDTYGLFPGSRIFALTTTLQHDLWKNVISRVEFRWDHSCSGAIFGGGSSSYPDRRNAFMLAVNAIYKF